MNSSAVVGRGVWWKAVVIFFGIVVLARQEQVAVAQSDPDTLAPLPAAIFNGRFECPDGFQIDEHGRTLPAGWHLARADGNPELNSARVQYAGRCDNNAGHVERMDGRDSFSIRAKDIETPPAPGKPFDVILYQQVPVAPDGDYSVSGWMLSLCGGSAVPNDCPRGVYIRKAIGLDPEGGTDPDSPTIVWTENLDNFVDSNQARVGWSNLRVGARSRGHTMTVFLRVHSPFQWHGAHAFVDEIHFVRAPVAWFVALPRSVNPGGIMQVRWNGFQSPEIAEIQGGTHELLIDVQARTLGNSDWQDLVVGGAAPGQCGFQLGPAGTEYALRLRARAEQPSPPAPGAWPNQRFPGVWSEPQLVRVRPSAGGAQDNVAPGQNGVPSRLYLPALESQMTRVIRC